MSLERLAARGDRIGQDAIVRQIERLANIPTPPGVTVEPIDNGIALTGKVLRHRMLNDASLRNFGR